MPTNNLPVSVLIELIVTLITEAYAGPPNAKSTWFVDNEPDAGIFGAIKGITASQASRSGRSGYRGGLNDRGEHRTSSLEPGKRQLGTARRAVQLELE